MNKLTKLCIACLPAFSLMTACSSASGPVKVDPEKVDNELIKSVAELSSESSADQVQDVFGQLIDQTASEYNDSFEILQKRSQDNLEFDQEKPEKTTSTGTTYDVRAASDTAFYELNEELYDKQAGFGIIHQGLDSVTQMTGTMDPADFEKPEFDVDVIDCYSEKEDQGISKSEAYTINKNSLIYPIYALMGGTFTMPPVYNPELFNFETTLQDDTYTLSISIKDKDAYNKAINDFYSDQYGYNRTDLYGDQSLVFDKVESTKLNLTIDLSETGAIKNIDSVSQDVWTLDKVDYTIDASASTSIKPAGEDVFKQFEAVIASLKKKDPKASDVFAVSFNLNNDNTDSDQAADDSARKDDASKEESSKKDEEKTSDETKTSSDAKEDSSSSDQKEDK